MADEKRGDILSVELAIQRELAYRRQIAMLQMQSDIDFGKDLMPLQVQFSGPSPSQSLTSSPKPNSSPSPKLSGTKRQALTSNLEFLPPKQPQPFNSGHTLENTTDDLFCKVCQVLCSAAFNYKQHIDGQKHKAKRRELKFGRKDGGEDSTVAHQRAWCGLCEIWCMNEDLLQQHLKGRKHKDELEKLELARKAGGEIVKQQTWCELCNVGCMDEHLFEQHLNGKKHKAELENREFARKSGSEMTVKLKCDLCNVWCIDANAFQMHLKGKKHILQLHAIEEKKRASEGEAAVAKLDLEEKEWKRSGESICMLSSLSCQKSLLRK